jgi:hypothetical protein
MKVVSLDFETFYDTKAGYTLKRKMTTEEYIRDPRFHIHGCSVGWLGDQPVWLDRAAFEAWLSAFPLHEHACLCFHGQFEGLILSHHYGKVPRMWLDAMAMARAVNPKHLTFSLDFLSAYYGLPAKYIPYNLFDGKLWTDLSPNDQRLVADGCCHDNYLTQQLFLTDQRRLPPEEYMIIDQTIRMFTEPVLRANIPLLGEIWQAEEIKRQAFLTELNITIEDLRSDAKFKALLEAEGVEIEYKKSKTDEQKLIPQFAKTDPFMQDLVDDPDDRIATLALARLGARSNINQTRAERLGEMALRGAMCVYLSYCATRTTRWGGGDKLNWQNQPRSRRSDGSINRIREAIEVAAGYVALRPDLSQVECRILNTNAEQWDIVEAFRQGRDLYSELATKFYGRQITKADEPERGFGKQLELSCGYGAGEWSIIRTARSGAYGPPVYLTPADGKAAKELYRDTHPGVVSLWKEANHVLDYLHAGDEYRWGPLTVKNGRIWLPNGLPLCYDTLEWHTDPETGDQFWRVQKAPKRWQKTYGSALVADVTQAQARVVLSQAMLRVLQRAGDTITKIALSTHDDMVIIVRDDPGLIAETKALVIEELSVSPSWLPQVPLKAECVVSRTLAKGDD